MIKNQRKTAKSLVLVWYFHQFFLLLQKFRRNMGKWGVRNEMPFSYSTGSVHNFSPGDGDGENPSEDQLVGPARAGCYNTDPSFKLSPPSPSLSSLQHTTFVAAALIALKAAKCKAKEQF